MKRIILLTAAAIVLNIASAVAGSGNTIHSVITKKIKVPVQLKDQKLNEKVNVQFKIEQNGSASVLDVKTSNPELRNYVIKQFKDINFSDVTERQGVVYFIDINFKVL